MQILVFGLEGEDAILPELRKRFPSVGFKKSDLSHDLEEEGRALVVIDTVPGLERVELIDDVRTVSPGRAMEGSGALMTLRILVSLGTIDSARMIAVPKGCPPAAAVEGMDSAIRELMK